MVDRLLEGWSHRNSALGTPRSAPFTLPSGVARTHARYPVLGRDPYPTFSRKHARPFQERHEAPTLPASSNLRNNRWTLARFDETPRTPDSQGAARRRPS